MHKKMKSLFSYNFGKSIVSNRLIFSLIFAVLFISVFTFITTVEGLQITITSEKVADVDPNTPGDQPGTVFTFVTQGEGELSTSDFRVGDVSYDEYTGYKSFVKVNDNTYKLTIGPIIPSISDPEGEANNQLNQQKPATASAISPKSAPSNGPTSLSQQKPATASATSTESSPGDDLTSPNQPEHRTDPTTSTGNEGNGTVTPGNTGISTSTAQPIARRASNLRTVSGNAQTAKVNSLLHPFVVRVSDQYGAAMSGINVTFSTSGDGRLSATSDTTDANGLARTTLTLGSAPGTYTVTAKVTGTTFSQTFTAEATPRILSRLEVRGESHWSVPVGRWIKPLKVRILDTDNDPVSGEQVTFSVVSDSTGTAEPLTREVLSNATGLAKGYFMPSTPGTILVEAKAADLPPVQFTLTAFLPPSQLVKLSGDGQMGDPGTSLREAFVVEVLNKNGDPVSGATVKFAITAGGGRLSTTSTTTDSNGRAQTTLTLGSQREVNSVRASTSWVDPVVFSAAIEPKVLVAAANRPVMYWIDTGVLYRLVDAEPERIAGSVKGATIGGGKLYWTSQTGTSTGTINCTNLDGDPEVTVLTAIRSVPLGIAVDPVGGKLYWTNSRGRVQSANLEGSGVQNVMEDLSNPRDIVLHGESIYWTEGGDRIRRVNMKGQQVVQDVAVNLTNVGGLAVSGDKLYWTEQTGQSSGTINRANLDGMQFVTLTSIRSVPLGIAVDPVGGNLYWTNSRGRVQRANLDGAYIQNAVENLMSPSTLVIDSEALATVEVEQTQKDNAAAAPAIVGRQLSTVEVDRIQKQIDLLLATNDRSPAEMRTLVYLQQLLASARPVKTQLLPNYPNPFNPETWIPYHLANSTDVQISVYDAQGVLVRVLRLGHQSGGYYTSRSRAAYWDGRNAVGERVASGLYFYQLQTDDMSQMRKMLILK